MKNCPKCNAPCAPNASHCPKCGHEFTTASGIFWAILIGLILGGFFLANR